MNLMLVSLGTFGDVFPFIGLGRALQRRGHVVHIASHEQFRAFIEGAGFAFHQLGRVNALTGSADLYGPRAIERITEDVLVPAISPVYDLVTGLDRDRWTVLAHFFCYGARLSQERNGTRLITVCVNPSAIRSAEGMPVPPIMRWAPRAPLPLRRVFRSLESRIWKRGLAPTLNAYRSSLGMPPVRDIFYQWSLSPDRVIGLFPDWFAPRYADWPLAFLHGGFVRFEAEGGQSVPPELNRSADPLVVFTAGSAGAEARSFFAAAVAASRGQRWRSLLLTGFDNHLEGALPENVSCHPFIPLSVILPKSRLLVHHGGLGSASAALMAGIPQLVVPFGHDHFDNADRVKRLGVGREFRAKALKTKLTDAIMEMLRDETLHQRAIEISHRFPSDRSLSSLCAMIEAPLNERLRAQQASRRSSLTP